MSVLISESEIDLKIAHLELGALAKGPFPGLKALGTSSIRTFRAVKVENDAIAIWIVPDLGGRLTQLHDKRTGLDLFTDDYSRVSLAGPRQAHVFGGMEWSSTGEPRNSAMGPVQFQIVEPTDGQPMGGVWVAETGAGNGVGLHVGFFMSADRAEVRMEFRASNRLSGPVPYNASFLTSIPDVQFQKSDYGVGWYDLEQDFGIYLVPEGQLISYPTPLNQRLVVSRFEEVQPLGAYQTDAFVLRLVPFSGFGTTPSMNEAFAMRVAEDDVVIQSIADEAGMKLFVQTEPGQTLEAGVELRFDRMNRVELGGLKAREVALRDEKKEIRLRYPSFPLPTSAPRLESPVQREFIIPDEVSVEQLLHLTFFSETRVAAYVGLAKANLKEADYAGALSMVNQALMYQGDCARLWWLKAVFARKAGVETDDLMNGHFLAPLDPLLRAEAFLCQAMTMGKEPSPLFRAWLSTPEEFVWVACELLDLGLADEAARWLDEALRHQDLPSLRYLLSFAYLQGSRMRMEANQQAIAGQNAGELSFAPDHPIYRVACERVAQEFGFQLETMLGSR